MDIGFTIPRIGGWKLRRFDSIDGWVLSFVFPDHTAIGAAILLATVLACRLL